MNLIILQLQDERDLMKPDCDKKFVHLNLKPAELKYLQITF